MDAIVCFARTVSADSGEKARGQPGSSDFETFTESACPLFAARTIPRLTAETFSVKKMHPRLGLTFRRNALLTNGHYTPSALDVLKPRWTSCSYNSRSFCATFPVQKIISNINIYTYRKTITTLEIVIIIEIAPESITITVYINSTYFAMCDFFTCN